MERLVTRQELIEDLSFVRAMAEEGRAAPLIGGRFMIFWGVWFSVVLLIHWSIVTKTLPVGMDMLWVLWVGQGIIGGLLQIPLINSAKAAPGASSVNNRVAKAVWGGVMPGMLACWIGVAIATLQFGAPYILWNTLPAIALMLYGVAHYATSQISGGQGRIAAAVAFLSALACFATVPMVETYLVSAAGVFASCVIPGVVQMLREPRATV